MINLKFNGTLPNQMALSFLTMATMVYKKEDSKTSLALYLLVILGQEKVVKKAMG